MVRRHYARPHRFICVTDDGAGLDGIEVVPDWRDFVDVPSPHGRGAPSCYRRLRAWHPDIAEHFGERFVLLDLDTVAVADLAPLWDREEDAVFLRDAYWPKQYNGSMALIRAGAAPEVWTGFNPTRSPLAAISAGFKGSDQGYLSHALPGRPTWGPEDGVYNWKFDVVRKHGGQLPENARIVFFTGRPKPWGPPGQALPFVREHWGTV